MHGASYTGVPLALSPAESRLGAQVDNELPISEDWKLSNRRDGAHHWCYQYSSAFQPAMHSSKCTCKVGIIHWARGGLEVWNTASANKTKTVVLTVEAVGECAVWSQLPSGHGVSEEMTHTDRTPFGPIGARRAAKKVFGCWLWQMADKFLALPILERFLAATTWRRPTVPSIDLARHLAEQKQKILVPVFYASRSCHDRLLGVSISCLWQQLHWREDLLYLVSRQ